MLRPLVFSKQMIDIEAALIPLTCVFQNNIIHVSERGPEPDAVMGACDGDRRHLTWVPTLKSLRLISWARPAPRLA
jgi:hypothetical protein